MPSCTCWPVGKTISWRGPSCCGAPPYVSALSALLQLTVKLVGWATAAKLTQRKDCQDDLSYPIQRLQSTAALTKALNIQQHSVCTVGVAD